MVIHYNVPDFRRLLLHVCKAKQENGTSNDRVPGARAGMAYSGLKLYVQFGQKEQYSRHVHPEIIYPLTYILTKANAFANFKEKSTESMKSLHS